MGFIMVYITCGNEESAQNLSEALLQEKRIACANLFPIKSGYWWQGDITSENEWVSIAKTVPENWETLQKRIIELHPYENPAVIRIDVNSTEAYEEWIRSEVLTSHT